MHYCSPVAANRACLESEFVWHAFRIELVSMPQKELANPQHGRAGRVLRPNGVCLTAPVWLPLQYLVFSVKQHHNKGVNEANKRLACCSPGDSLYPRCTHLGSGLGPSRHVSLTWAKLSRETHTPDELHEERHMHSSGKLSSHLQG